MGLIKAAAAGIGSTLADQWLEYIYCDEMPNNVLMRKGKKRVGQKSSNTKGSDNIITRGSRIAVNEGQFLLVVDDGKIVDFTDETGAYTYDKSSEPSLFYGGFGKGLLKSFELVGKRLSFGGDPGHDQRVYFINKKLITDNKFGTKQPVPFRDSEWNMTVRITCFGTFTYRVTDPLLFYANLAGNADYEYCIDQFEEQFKSDLGASLLPALGSVAAQHVSYDMLPSATTQLTAAVQAALKLNWEDKVGINVDRVSIEGVSPVDEDAAKIQKLQETRVYSDSQFASGAMNQAKVGYVTGLGQGAAKGGGEGGGMNGAMNMMGAAMMGGMMGNMGMGNPFQPNQQQPQQSQYQTPQQPQQPTPPPVPPTAPVSPAGSSAGGASTADVWTCDCGAQNTGKFCEQCGKPKPTASGAQGQAAPTNLEWTCECGTVNTGKFCQNCGKPKPVIRRYKCDKCGWVPPDPTKPPKFCPECGDVFNDSDIQ